jgi:pimeloyl-ACP methyl ester carboxylesterase
MPIQCERGLVDYDEAGAGPTLVLVPGSCSTGVAWRPMVDAWNGAFRTVTTSLLGYGGTAERRTARDPSIDYEAEIVEMVIARAGGPVHLVGHSFGGITALAVALRGRVELASLSVLEAPAAGLLHEFGEEEHYRSFRRMTDAYVADYAGGNSEAIAAMIDFYGGPGTFASWPERVRAYAVRTTPVNILDWACGYGFDLTAPRLERLALPALVVCGENSHPAVQCANALLARSLGAEFHELDGTAHFMISTHPAEVAGLVARHVSRSARTAYS